MALLNIGEDPWLLEHESCEKLYRDIMEQLSLRQREIRTSDAFARISANIRLRLKQYNNEVGQLNQKLSQITSSITGDELERRTRQVETLQSKGIQMQRLFDNHGNKSTQECSQLMNLPGVSSWDDDENAISVDVSHLSEAEIRAQQKRMLGEQEQGLEHLSKIISRQKDIAKTINNEVDLHNDILDDLGDHIDRTDVRVRNEIQNIGIVDRKDKTCIYWVIIILLFISIITVVSI